jgi:multidrug efflux pump subunit AcrA (membrane-fusion protein)
MKTRKTLALVLFVLSVAALLSCGGPPGRRPAAGGSATPPEEAATVFAVNTTTAVEGEILDYIEVNGDVMTRTTVDIYAETAGKLTTVAVRVGDYVTKDQVVAEVDPSRPGTKFVASPVKSPISGTIIEVPGQIGATITPSIPVARVGRLSELEIRAEVAERFISKMRPGLEAVIRFDAYPDERFAARLTEISPVVDPQTRTLEVTLRLQRADSRVKAGMFGEVKIITEKKSDIVKIPSEVLVRRYGQYFVFVVEGEKVLRREVNPGIEIDNKVEITEGLSPGEEVVIRGQTLLEDDARIRVIGQVPPLPSGDTIQ